MEQTAFHRRRLSWRRLTRLSSASCSSKQLIGARKMIALISSKYGYHAFRCETVERCQQEKAI